MTDKYIYEANYVDPGMGTNYKFYFMSSIKDMSVVANKIDRTVFENCFISKLCYVSNISFIGIAHKLED